MASSTVCQSTCKPIVEARGQDKDISSSHNPLVKLTDLTRFVSQINKFRNMVEMDVRLAKSQIIMHTNNSDLSSSISA